MTHTPKDEEQELLLFNDAVMDGDYAEVPPPDPPPPPEEPELPPIEQADLPVVDLPPHKTLAQPAMHPTALVFLDDPLARRLAVAWTSCRGVEEQWLEAAGIERGLFADANRLTSALRINHICREGGVTDSLALRYISSIVAKQLTPTNRKEPK